jgi:hypothetical protein
VRSPRRCKSSVCVFAYTVLALCDLYFVVTGIQFWVISYIIVVLGKTQAEVTPVFGVTSIVAPTLRARARPWDQRPVR